LKTKWEHDKKKKDVTSLVVHSNEESKLIRMALHKRLENIQPPPTMDGIVLVIVDGLMHGATNEPMTSMLEDQVESNVGSWKKMFQSKHYR
jgi:hypothetical protein